MRQGCVKELKTHDWLDNMQTIATPRHSAPLAPDDFFLRADSNGPASKSLRNAAALIAARLALCNDGQTRIATFY